MPNEIVPSFFQALWNHSFRKHSKPFLFRYQYDRSGMMLRYQNHKMLLCKSIFLLWCLTETAFSICICIFLFLYVSAHSLYPGVFESLHAAVCVGSGCDLIRHAGFPHCTSTTGHHLLLHTEILQSRIKVTKPFTSPLQLFVQDIGEIHV